MVDIGTLMNLFKSKKYIGLDVGSSHVKAVQLEKVEGGFKLVMTAMVKLPDTLSHMDRVRRMQHFLHEKRFPLGGHISVNIENRTLLIRRMSLPKMPDRDMIIAIKWNFREFVEGSIDNYTVTYSPIKGFMDGEKMLVSAYCISRETVEQRSVFMKDSGVKVEAVEPNASALLSVINNVIPPRLDTFYVVLDLGDSVSNFVVVGNGCLLFSRTLTNLFGRKLLEQVEKDLKVKREIAEEALKNFLLGNKDDKTGEAAPVAETAAGIQEMVSQFISQMVIEIQRSIDAFCIMYNKDRVDKIYLCGGGICLPGIVERLSTGLGVEVEFLNPFASILEAETVSKMVSAPMYAVAVGLALSAE